MKKRRVSFQGFTLLELLTVVLIVGLLSAISAPIGFRLLERARVTQSRDEAYSAIRKAQRTAQQESTSWQFAIRYRDDKVEWATYSVSSSGLSANWQTLGNQSLRIDEETNLAEAGGLYYVRFDERGNVEYRLGRVTFSSEHFPEIKRCVVVSTLIGAMRKSKEQPFPHDDKLCY